MSRWGKPTKNKRRRDPRHHLTEGDDYHFGFDPESNPPRIGQQHSRPALLTAEGDTPEDVAAEMLASGQEITEETANNAILGRVLDDDIPDFVEEILKIAEDWGQPTPWLEPGVSPRDVNEGVNLDPLIELLNEATTQPATDTFGSNVKSVAHSFQGTKGGKGSYASDEDVRTTITPGEDWGTAKGSQDPKLKKGQPYDVQTRMGQFGGDKPKGRGSYMLGRYVSQDDPGESHAVTQVTGRAQPLRNPLKWAGGKLGLGTGDVSATYTGATPTRKASNIMGTWKGKGADVARTAVASTNKPLQALDTSGQSSQGLYGQVRESSDIQVLDSELEQMIREELMSVLQEEK